ncbi:peptidoglycan-binding/hydrolysing protein [Clostridioides difficile]|uniref:peptidoglycan-binding domain-containing protein n=1 Tax=Clostridioides difficile TaxID=1496 RepID=UPI0010279C35|nr:peptidoglycan-binding domain-containing protein [Clostridioides difficile]UUV16654.1 peptidoglycan-binding protein [Clostridioides difficile]VFF93638.1 peptidoglycan-binding/hydrolysing protein [Clostridioides difficile]VIG17537.1 peptidoglycan-binding/hydrolysing protein [Clostridioides difficile]HBF4772720.1 peptidoglycan-binding protein [Clostridioides difficile]HBF5038269.1 peptidoglycan-binding protein [Clostridioides difficile]
MLKKIKKTLTIICCSMLVFTNTAFADTEKQGGETKSISENKVINFEINVYKYIYKDAPQQIKDNYDEKCNALNITPDPNAEIFVPINSNLLKSDEYDIGTYSSYYGTYDPDKATIKITGDRNYTISTRTLVGFGHVTSGNNVHCVQLMLCDVGYKVQIDSLFGNDTYDAVKRFQRAYALSSDGIVGYNTYDRLANLLRM